METSIQRPSRVWLAIIVLYAISARAQAPAELPAIKPIESLWLTSPQLFTGPSTELKNWRRVFDGIMLLKLPPTFSDNGDFTTRANALIKDVGGEFVLVTLPVGTEGWESSANRRLAERQPGGHYDPAKAVPQLQWLETLRGIDSSTWAWILEQPARMPSPEQAAKSAAEFVRFAKAQHKKAAIWLSAEALTKPRFEELTRSICEATSAGADFYGWMDLPGAAMQAGANWQESLNALLDEILAMTPREKTIIQWSHLPNLPTKDVAGTTAYIIACQAKGINRFCLLSRPQFLGRSPWNDFYRRLPKTAR